jgi:hypothetical protein
MMRKPLIWSLFLMVFATAWQSIVAAPQCQHQHHLPSPLRTHEPSNSQSNHPFQAPITSSAESALTIRGGGWVIPAGWNPLGYKITSLGEEYLSYDGSLESDVGRFLASLKSGRKRFTTLKEQWLEVLRVSKTAQSMRIYKNLSELLQFCLRAGLVD